MCIWCRPTKRSAPKSILIATGGRPFVPDGIEGREHAITSNEAFHLAALPKERDGRGWRVYRD